MEKVINVLVNQMIYLKIYISSDERLTTIYIVLKTSVLKDIYLENLPYSSVDQMILGKSYFLGNFITLAVNMRTIPNIAELHITVMYTVIMNIILLPSTE